MTSTPR
jgi:hypothetical protein